MRILGLGYIGVASRTLDGWNELAGDIFGMQVIESAAGSPVRLRLDERTWRIAIYPSERDEILYLGWELDGPKALDAALMELTAAGVSFSEADIDTCDERRVSRMAIVIDPEGFRHELFIGHEREPNTFRSGRPISGFVAGREGMGHAVLVLPEVTDAMRHFATQVLGFSVVSLARSRAQDGRVRTIEFYRCNHRSHCLAFISSGDAKGLSHVCVEVASLSDVGIAWDMVQDRGVPVKMTLGCHTLDNVLSFYVRSPGGFDIEYSLGGDYFEEDEELTQRISRPSIWGHKIMIKGWGSAVASTEKA